MAAKPKLFKDEQWLEDAFKVDISKFDKDLQDGGKKHDQFLKDVERLRIRVDIFRQKDMDKLLALHSDNPKVKKAQKDAESAHDKMIACVKKGDVTAAVRFSLETRDGLLAMGEALTEGHKKVLVLPTSGNLQSIGGAILGIGDPSEQTGQRGSR